MSQTNLRLSQTNLRLSDLEFLDLVSMDKYILEELTTVLHEVDLTNSAALRAVECGVWSTQCGVWGVEYTDRRRSAWGRELQPNLFLQTIYQGGVAATISRVRRPLTFPVCELYSSTALSK